MKLLSQSGPFPYPFTRLSQLDQTCISPIFEDRWNFQFVSYGKSLAKSAYRFGKTATGNQKHLFVRLNGRRGSSCLWFGPHFLAGTQAKHRAPRHAMKSVPKQKASQPLGGQYEVQRKLKKSCSQARHAIFWRCLFSFSAAARRISQQITGTIVGTVKDARGAVVTTATVKATNVDTGYSRSAPTNGVGEYRIDYLPVGKYTVEASAAGFERFVQQNISLDVEQELTVHITLAVGAATQTVTVTEAPPTINTSNAVLGVTIEPDDIVGLPMVNRNIYTLVSLTPGVMANNNSSTCEPHRHTNHRHRAVYRGCADQRLHRRGNAAVGFYLDGGNNITGCATTATRRPIPTQWKNFAWRPAHSARNTANFPRRGLGDHQVGNQPVAWQFVRVQPQHRLQRQQLDPGTERRRRRSSFRLTTATSLAVPWAGRSRKTKPSSSSAMEVCARSPDSSLPAPSRPPPQSAWATLPRTPSPSTRQEYDATPKRATR